MTTFAAAAALSRSRSGCGVPIGPNSAVRSRAFAICRHVTVELQLHTGRRQSGACLMPSMLNERARDTRLQTSVWHDRKELSAGCEEDTEGARQSIRSHAARLSPPFLASGIAASAAAIDDVISSCTGKRCNSASGVPDAVKVFAFGFSMGGHMALQMAG